MTPASEEARNPAEPRPCAICGKPQAARFRPFCSRRCADIDLNRWLKGGYVIPASDEDEERAPAPDDDAG